MSTKESEIAKSLGSDDKVLKSYTGDLEKKYGTLFLSNKRLLFVKEEGFLKKTYTTTLNLPYGEIKKIERHGEHLEFVDAKDKVHVFTSDVSTVIEASIRELMNKSS
jgi:hypothetical protein